MDRRLITIPEVSQILEVNVQRAYELVRLGLIPSVRLGRQVRVDSKSLEDFIEKGGKALSGGWKKE